jgi:hypothetical protein
LTVSGITQGQAGTAASAKAKPVMAPVQGVENSKLPAA